MQNKDIPPQFYNNLPYRQIVLELSLFTGAGGGLLGTKLLGFQHVGYVEIDEYCQRIIAQRIKDGLIDNAPIFSDIKTFITEGYAYSYSGLVDVISAGFPCQPFSAAGKRGGENDPRNMWPATINAIRIIRPEFVYLENVPGLLANGYTKRIFGQLVESGFDIRWGLLSASTVGAPHIRRRLWVLAHANNKRQLQPQGTDPKERGWSGDFCEKIPDPFVSRRTVIQKQQGKTKPTRHPKPAPGGWWDIEPDVGRVADGVANRVDRLKALGNGQVPAVVATAFKELMNL